MAERPSLSNVPVKPCCQGTLAEIKRRMESGGLLKQALVAAPFFSSMFDHPSVTFVSLGTFEWKIWGDAVTAVDIIVRRRCQDISGFEVLNHADDPLNKFWKAMYDSFQ